MGTVGRLKDGEMLIAGEYNERLPVITNGLVSHFPMDGAGGTFDLVGGFQPIQHTTGNLNLAEAMNLNWRNPSSWRKRIDYDTGVVSWDESKQAIKFTGQFQGDLLIPIVIDYTKHYQVKVTYMQESQSATNYLYLGGFSALANGASFNGGAWDYSLGSGLKPTLNQWKTATVTRFGTGYYPTGWTGSQGLAVKYYFGGLFNYDCRNTTDVVYIKDISIIVTDADNSNCTFTYDGIAVEEATTNVVANPLTWSGWINTGNSVLTNEYFSDGNSSGKIFRMPTSKSTSATILYSPTYSVSTGQTITFSFWARKTGGSGNQIYIDPDAYNASSVQVTVTPAMALITVIDDGQWHRYSYSFVISGANAVNSRVYFYHSSATYWNIDFDVALPQMEIKSFATSFVNGSRSAGSFNIPFSLTPPYSINVTHKSSVPSSSVTTQATSPVIFALGHYYTNASIIFWNYTGYLRVYAKGDTGTGWCVTSTFVALDSSNWDNKENTYTLVVESSTSFKLYMNGNLLGTRTFSVAVTSINGSFLSFSQTGGIISDAIYKNLSIYNRALTADEVKKLYNSKLSIESDGDIKQVTVKESPAIPSDVYYFQLTLNGKDRYGVISPQTDTNVVYSKEGAWVGTAVTNLANVSDFTYWINSGNGNDLPDGIPRLQSDAPVYGMICTAAGSIGCYGGEATISPSSVYSIGVDAYYSSCTTGNPYAREYRTSAPGGANSTYLEYQTKDAVGTIIPQNKWVNVIYQNITAAADANTVRYSAYIANAGEKLYFTRPMIVSRPFLPPFVNGSRGAGLLMYNLNGNLGLDWNGDWSIVYWKKPIGTTNDMVGYNLDSFGYNGNSVGGGYSYWGKTNNANTLTRAGTTVYSFTNYFNKWHMISVVKSGTNVVYNFWGIDGTIQSSTHAIGTIVSNYYLNQNGWDFQIGGWQGGGSSNCYVKDLVVAKRALTDTELTTIYNTQMRAYNSNSTLLIRNGINETNNL